MVFNMNSTVRYTIRPYDTIWMLAQVFNTSVDDIMELNPDIDPRNLRIGQVITLSPGDYNYPTNSNQQNNSDNGMNNNRNSNMNGNMNSNMNSNRNSNTNNNRNGNMNSNTNSSMNSNMNGNMNSNTNSNTNSSMNGNMNSNMNSNMNNGRNNNSMNSNDDNTNNWNNYMDEYIDDYMDNGMNNEDHNVVSDLFRMLWVQHVYWTRMAVMSLIHDLPETDFVLRRLLRNSVDFANALRPYYGEEAAVEFTDLMNGHITIAAELVNALLADNDQAIMDADQRWHDNAEQIAEFFASINPNWSVEDWSAMMDEHLELLSQNITNMIAGNYEESINDFDTIESQAIEMADMMAEGIEAQFPD